MKKYLYVLITLFPYTTLFRSLYVVSMHKLRFGIRIMEMGRLLILLCGVIGLIRM